ncbi:MAG: hypothetical protein AB4372_37780 [Xenococcus sp. (in: cyanobacteria)]
MTTISANKGKVSGSLLLQDHPNPYRLNAFQDDYTLVDFTLGQTIELDLSSEEFDTYLQLINSDTGEIIAENDDFDGSSNSRLSFIAEENLNYLVRVTSYSSGEVGNYTLTADKPDIDLIIEDAEAIIVTKKYPDDIFDPYYDPYYDSYDNEAYINLDLSWTVKNLGNETIFVDLDNDDYYYYESGLTDSVYLSSDEYFNEFEDYWIAEFRHQSDLEAGKSYTNKFAASIYKRDIWGRENNYLIFVTDSFNDQNEANEDNNTYAIPLDLDLNQTTPDVDLIITDATATVRSYNEYYGDIYLDLSLSITNQGTETALGFPDEYDYHGYEPNWYNAVYLSSDDHFDPVEDYYITEIWHEYDLAGGESDTNYSNSSAYLYDYNFDQTENNYLIFVADSSNYQYETNEDNNTYTIPLDLTPPDVDLVVTNAAAKLQYYDQYSGDAYLDFSLTVTNQGSDTIHNFYGYNTVYLSSDEHFNNYEDYWVSDLGYDYYGISLEAGANYTSESFGAYISAAQLNALGSGELNLLFVSDPYDSYYEIDETNNSLVVSLDNLLVTPIYRFHNIDLPGSYLFVAEEERSQINYNHTEFYEEGIAFKVATKPQDDLIPLYRFQSKTVPGTYLYAGAEERASIHQNYSDYFIEEGLSFYVYGVGEGKGVTFYRFRNDNSNLGSTYLFATGAEAENIRHNFPNFIEEGAAFEAVI